MSDEEQRRLRIAATALVGMGKDLARAMKAMIPALTALARIAYNIHGAPFGDSDAGFLIWCRYQQFTTDN